MAQGTGTPKVVTNVSNGNLLRQVNITDGVAGIVGTAYLPENIGNVQIVYSLPDAESKGYKEEDEPVLYRQISEFYEELGGSQELWILGVEDTMTLTNAVTSTNQNGLKKLLNVSKGRVNLAGVIRKPASTYNAGNGFLDQDVTTALTAAKSLGQYQQSINRPVRILLEGRVNDVTKTPIFQPKTAENTFCGVVLGGTLPDGSASVGVALARACKYPAHVKIGNGQNGALSVTSAYIGNREIDEIDPVELDNFTNFGYIHYHTRDAISGYFFSVDKMAGTDDFHILAHGRIIDKAQRITTTSNIPFLENHVRMTKEGGIKEEDAIYLEQVIKSTILSSMAGQISDADVQVETNVDLINTSESIMEVAVLPLGYMTWIRVKIGLTNKI